MRRDDDLASVADVCEHADNLVIDVAVVQIVLRLVDQKWFTTSGQRKSEKRSRSLLGSILRGVAIPPVGGDTCFADATAAYDRLSPAWKERVDDLYAIHDFSRTFGRRMSEEERAAKREKFEDMIGLAVEAGVDAVGWRG